MARKGPGRPILLPPDAFDYWVGLGPYRKYADVARHYKVHERTVYQRAKVDGWRDRLDAIEEKARDKMDKKHVDTIASINERHLKSLRAVQMRAVEALQKYRIRNAMDASKALDSSIKLERLIIGEPTERSEVSIEETIRREYERWMVVQDEGGDEEGKAETA